MKFRKLHFFNKLITAAWMGLLLIGSTLTQGIVSVAHLSEHLPIRTQEQQSSQIETQHDFANHGGECEKCLTSRLWSFTLRNFETCATDLPLNSHFLVPVEKVLALGFSILIQSRAPPSFV
jgi:hypothetical protein